MDSTDPHPGADERLEELIHDILANADPNIKGRVDMRIKKELDTIVSKFAILFILSILGWIIVKQLGCLLFWLSNLWLYNFR
jgi:hypothetical protein